MDETSNEEWSKQAEPFSISVHEGTTIIGLHCNMQELGNPICNKGGVSHCGLAVYILKSILRQKKNYGNSNIISPCKNIPNLQKQSSETNQNPSRYYNSI
jgi:hypothetical protein